MNSVFFNYTLDCEDLENCLDAMEINITPEAVKKMKNLIMEHDGSRLCEKLTETAQTTRKANRIYSRISIVRPPICPQAAHNTPPDVHW